mgnify:CR=1 FL=1
MLVLEWGNPLLWTARKILGCWTSQLYRGSKLLLRRKLQPKCHMTQFSITRNLILTTKLMTLRFTTGFLILKINLMKEIKIISIYAEAPGKEIKPQLTCQ